MKNIKLKFAGLGLKDYLQANIKIYDSNCNLIFEGKTYNGEVSCLLNTDQCYKVVAYYCYGYVSIWFYVSNACCYKFYFNNIVDNDVTFLLTDYYYSNLPIEKGELILWQR